jgi:hypothetical protein
VGHIGTEEKCHTDANGCVAHKEHNPSHPQLVKDHFAKDCHPHIEQQAIDDCSQE